MHNESMAKQIVDSTAESINGNGVFEPGETGIAFNKDETGVKFGLRLSNRQLFGTVAILVGTAILKTVGKKVVANADIAKAAHQAVDKVEEVAA